MGFADSSQVAAMSGLILRAVVHPANVADRDGVFAVLAPLPALFPALHHFWADNEVSGAPAPLGTNDAQRSPRHCLAGMAVVARARRRGLVAGATADRAGPALDSRTDLRLARPLSMAQQGL